ncbi:MAG: hypothetical protein KatS3mg105_5264 [Gemmatales bacterium]|nr:MAG: hypothetical protein KatS3mg105_5264 [Gemmatales bacterium]GIW99047.1 MAG: hypothetical protein KatS3mg111_2380 [Pirellulaceae bacterium]
MSDEFDPKVDLPGLDAWVKRDPDGTVWSLGVSGPEGATFETRLLGKLPNLRSIRLWDVQIEPSIWDGLTQLPDLRTVEMLGVRNNCRGVRKLKACPKLFKLDLRDRAVDDATLREIVEITQLEELVLIDTSVFDIRPIEPLANQLRYLDLSGTQVGDAQMGTVARCWKLRQLGLEGTRVSDEGLRCLTSLKYLKYLTIQESYITTKAFSILPWFHDLEILYIGLPVTEDALQHLRQLMRLRELYVGDAVSEEEKEKIEQYLGAVVE